MIQTLEYQSSGRRLGHNNESSLPVAAGKMVWINFCRLVQLSVSLAVMLGFGTATAQDPVDASPGNPAIQSSAALRVVRGKHVVLTSDSGTQESLNELVIAFDAAVVQWERFFDLPPGKLDDWSIDAYLMTDRQRFHDAGLLPDDLEFIFGYAVGRKVWLMRQPSDYYTRHLLLHEGVHALAVFLYGGTGPSWFAEGTAEMLSVHRGLGSDVIVNTVPLSRESVPYWGRFKLMTQRRIEHRLPALETVLDYPRDLKGDAESYAWSWAAMMLLTEYPSYRPTMMQAAAGGSDRSPTFSMALRHQLDPQWPIIEARWRMLVNTLDYGFDWSRERIELSMKDRLWNGQPIRAEIQSDRGWQSLGGRFAKGMRVKISASGQCTLDNRTDSGPTKPWVSQPPGVTIHYAGDRPLGQLILCVLPNVSDERQVLRPLQIEAVDADIEITFDQHSWLLFRINDELNGMDNNQGHYTVTVTR
ncbi:hypothetical protein NHH03_18405 [Stieleria sp. TO1_6]|uniref:hypothetical protein n=1 Tax=Stieleria tagensis TaxID=2956795 RepID=UPI00209B4DB3|nr:hypothetical protein [Stieleria tagensis]MCO8123724.1 hypothetical protein [Stieleria tagensis]